MSTLSQPYSTLRFQVINLKEVSYFLAKGTSLWSTNDIISRKKKKKKRKGFKTRVEHRTQEW